MKKGIHDEKRPIRVLIMNRFDPFSHIGGIEIFVRNLSLELSNLGYEVHIVFESNKDAAIKKNTKLILHPIYCSTFPYFFYISPNPKDLYYFFRKRQFLKKYSKEFDFIICQDWTGGLAYLMTGQRHLFVWYAHDTGSAVLKMLPFVPLRYKLHYIIFYSFISFAEKSICKKADLIIAIAKCVKDDVHRYYNIPLEKIIVNYHGLPSNFSDGIKTSFPVVPTFLHIATDYPRKGTQYLLHALHVLQERYNIKVKAIIVGGKDPHYVNIANNLGVDASFVGNVSEIELKHLYASCTCLVVPSIREGFCLPVIEAASFGKPSIVTNVGSLPELVKDNVNGFVVPLADINSLAEKMYILATNGDILRRLSSNAKKDSEEFEMNATAKRLIDAINHALKI